MNNKRDLLKPLQEKTDAEKFFMMSVEALKMGQRLDNGRHYLMGTTSEKFTVEDCLEAFGFRRDGLGDAD